MKSTTNKKVKSNRQKFNIPLQIMVTKKLEEDIDKRLQKLSKTKADYVRGLIVEDLSNGVTA